MIILKSLKFDHPALIFYYHSNCSSGYGNGNGGDGDDVELLKFLDFY